MTDNTTTTSQTFLPKGTWVRLTRDLTDFNGVELRAGFEVEEFITAGDPAKDEIEDALAIHGHGGATTVEWDTEAMRLRVERDEARRDVKAMLPRTNGAARELADLRDKLATAREGLARARDEAAEIAIERDNLSVELDDARAEVERLRGEAACEPAQAEAEPLKVECPALLCPNSFIGPEAPAQLLQHWNQWHGSPGIAPVAAELDTGEA